MSDWKLHESALLDERYYSCVHPSALPIYVFPKKMSTTYAMLAVKYGAVDNLANEQGAALLPDGVAHFLEHKLFANEDGSDAFEHFSAFGADANAYTAHSRTVYLFSCAEKFDESLAELIDFVTHPYFTRENVEKEKGIIAEEIRMCRDDPYDRCYRNMLMGLYQRHPVRVDICGSERSIGEITEQTLYRAYRDFYELSNMALVICGDVTPERVMEITNKHLPASAAPHSVERVTISEPAGIVKPFLQAVGQVAKPIFCIGIKDTEVPSDPALCMKRDATMEILCEMLFSDTGELYNTLLDKGLISPEFSTGYTLTRDFGFLRISGEADAPELVLREIKDFLQKALQNGLSEQEFEHCRRIVFAEYIKGFDSTEEIADNLVAFLFDGVDIFDYPAVIQSVTKEDAEQLAKEFFVPERFTLSVVRAGEE